jgi:DNA polymerase III epsilon subunit-like protein
MRLVSIDIETTGLDPLTCSVLEIGAVVFDPAPRLAVDGKVNAPGRKWHTFQRLVKHTRVQGEPYALAMNAEILAELSGQKSTHVEQDYAPNVLHQLDDFLKKHQPKGEKFTIVGKNFDAFDARFLERIPGWDRIQKRCERRTLDIGSLCFRPGDGRVVNLTDCLAMLGIHDTVSHRALDDALQVATVVSRFFA